MIPRYRKMEYLRKYRQEEDVMFYSNGHPDIVCIKVDIEEINNELIADNKRAILLYNVARNGGRDIFMVTYTHILEDVTEEEFNKIHKILSNTDRYPGIPLELQPDYDWDEENYYSFDEVYPAIILIIRSNFIIMSGYIYSLMKQMCDD